MSLAKCFIVLFCFIKPIKIRPVQLAILYTLLLPSSIYAQEELQEEETERPPTVLSPAPEFENNDPLGDGHRLIRDRWWPGSRLFDRAPGFSLNEHLQLHVGGGLLGGWENNFLYLSSYMFRAGHIATVLFMQLETQDQVENHDPQQSYPVDISLEVACGYTEFVGTNSDITSRRDIDVDIDFSIHVLPDRLISFVLSDVFLRRGWGWPRTPNDTFYVGQRVPWSIPRPEPREIDINKSTLFLRIFPESNFFDLRFGYSVLLRYFEKERSYYHPEATMTNEVVVETRFRFRLAVLSFSGIFHTFNYKKDSSGIEYPSPTSNTARGGVALAFRYGFFGFHARVGYEGRIMEHSENDHDAYGGIELRFHLGTDGMIALAYSRETFDSFNSNFYRRQRTYATYRHLLFDRLGVVIELGFSSIKFAPIVVSSTESFQRTDPILDLRSLVEFRALDWLAITASVEYLANFTSYVRCYDEFYTCSVYDFHHVSFSTGIRASY